MKISLIFTVPNAHISLWLYKMCQMVATFFCVKFSSKLQETHIKTELPSASWKQAQILYYSIFVCEIRDSLRLMLEADAMVNNLILLKAQPGQCISNIYIYLYASDSGFKDR